MKQYEITPHDKDPDLWEIAKARAAFKGHLTTYIIINIFIWIVWYMSGHKMGHNNIPWAIWPTIGWGIGLTFHYLGAYVFPKTFSIQNEYEKLKKQQ